MRFSLLFALLVMVSCAHAEMAKPDTLAAGDVITLHGARVTSEQVLKAAAEARYVMLGELHDDPRHHVLQNAVLTAIAEARRRPSVVFEMLEAAQALAIKTARDPETFGEVVHWEQRGWPAYAMYQPIVTTAMASGMALAGGNLDGKALIKAAKAGENAASLGFTTALPPEQIAKIEENVRVGHCGHANDATVQTMSAAQQLRDAYLARRMLESATSDGAVLIAGAEHARKDHGAAFHIPTALSIGFVEVGEDVPDDAFDIIWRTPKIERQDPCEEFRKNLEKL
jgi:uncharacterized iron-regulated protein